MTATKTIEAISPQERERLKDEVEEVIVGYRRGADILDDMEYLYEHAHRSAEPLGLLLIGPRGAGKTTLCKVFERMHPGDDTGRTMHRPVVRVTVPEGANPNDLASAILRGLGDPRWDKGKLTNLTFRILSFLRDVGTRVLVLDEIQQFVDADGGKLQRRGADWLKNLIKDDEVRLSLVLAGMPGDSELLLTASKGQLERFFGDARTVGPLSWTDGTDTELSEFRRFLRDVEEKLPLKGSSNLAELDTAWRIFVGTGGLMAFVMKLVRAAAHTAIDSDQDHITLQDLADAYDGHLAGERRDVPNPFYGPRPELPEYDYTAQNAPKSAGTNKRGGRRKGGSDGGNQRQTRGVLGV